MSAGAFARTARMATLPVSFAGRTAWGVGKRLGGRPAELVLSEVQQRTADQVFKVLGELKGGAMKFGQAMSVFEAAMPPELAEPYRQTLARLQDAAPPMSTAMVERQMEREFGPAWREKFMSFDTAPAAAASIGQVHRAVWADGTDVAVKVQYPGAAKALTSDLRQIGRLAKVIGTMLPIDVKPIVEELQERVLEELDYRLEAEGQSVFAEEFADDPDFTIARVLDFSDRVLVSEWLDSPYSLAHVISEGDQDERESVAIMYAKFLFAGPSRTGLLHADPHPGNFRIMNDGTLGIVDFGAVARLPGGLPPVIGRLIRAAADNRYDIVYEGLRDNDFILPSSAVDEKTLKAYLDPFVEVARHDDFSFSRTWLREQGARLSRPDREGLRTSLGLNLPPEYLLIHRVLTGGVGVLCQIGVTAPFRQMMLEYLPGFADSP